MYIQNIGLLIIGMLISSLVMKFFITPSDSVHKCFEMPGQTRIPQDKWRVDKK